METRIRTKEYKHDNSFRIGFYSYLPFQLLNIIAGITVYYRMSQIRGGVFGIILIFILVNLLALLISFEIKQEIKPKTWITTERFVEVKHGKIWRRLKGVEVE